MLKNYLKIAWKVLLRRKFFTFISLFGISFTLMVLIVNTAMIYHAVGPQYPEIKSDRMLYMNRMVLKGKESWSSSSPGFYFLEKHVRPLKTPQDVTIFTAERNYNSYINNRKIEMNVRFTDSNFWDVLDFNFVEGRPYNATEVKNISRVAVITEAMRELYFGEGKVLGKHIEVDQDTYEVIGVVENVPSLRRNVFSDIWIPYTNFEEDYRNAAFLGAFNAILLAKSAGDITKIKDEFEQERSIAVIPPEQAQDYNEINIYADTLPEAFIRWFTQKEGEISSMKFYAWIIGSMLLFMLLPAVNLININISRIMERASEIGVRKAFGASSSTLIMQFLVENVFLTLLGGIFGLLLTYGVLSMINKSGFFAYASLHINPQIFGYSFLICIFFGIVSGVYPAYKMSKLPAVAALKGGIK